MHMNPVGWFEIYVNDMSRARAFYESVLQTRLEKLEVDNLEMFAFPGDPERYGAQGALARMEGCPPGGNSTLIYFGCADCAVEAARAETAGGKIVRPKFGIGQWGHIALVLDTEGNLIGLHSMD